MTTTNTCTSDGPRDEMAVPTSQTFSTASDGNGNGQSEVEVDVDVEEGYDFECDDDEEEEASLSPPSESGQGQLESDKNEETDMASRRILYAKITILALLALTVIVASVVVHKSKMQALKLQTEFVDDAQEFVKVMTNRVTSTISTLDTLSNSVTSLTNYGAQVWPFVELPDFDTITSHDFVSQTAADAIVFAPFVSNEHKVEWEAFVAGAGNATTTDIQPHIWRKTYRQGRPGSDLTGGPYLPVWQTSQTPVDLTVTRNFNLLSDSTIKKAIDGSIAAELPALSGFLMEDAVISTAGRQEEKEQNHQDGLTPRWCPKSILVHPIHPHFQTSSITVAFLVAVLPWESLLRAASQDVGLHVPMTAVLTSQCQHDAANEPPGQALTFYIDGDHVKQPGEGDLHDDSFSDYKVASEFTFSGSLAGSCPYSLALYPDTDRMASNENSLTSISTIILVLLLLVGCAFITYDTLVQRRNRQVLQAASKTNKIISSLFPVSVHDRLFKTETSNPSNSTHRRRKGRRLGNSNSSLMNRYQPAKKSLANFLLSDESRTSQTSGEGTTEEANNNSKTRPKPIADLFPETTVMFCDIAGFTAWSSSREASHVFILLETVYNAFDGIAKRRKVFKVETIGDCYLAVAGLPTPRKDHAVVMVRFAHDCLVEFDKLAQDLELQLGPGTSDLAMRFGLHSGPTTAGVLRGEKTRFQLFGDTVNTASRMESTGQRHKIQVSTTTANLLAQARKSHWCERRKDPIVAKGKGEMITYWVNPKISVAGYQSSHSSDGCNSLATPDGSMGPHDSSSSEPNKTALPKGQSCEHKAAGNSNGGEMECSCELPEDTVDPKLQRSITWISGVLLGLLRQIVARRLAMGKKSVGQTQATRRARMAMQPEPGRLALDEWEEIINMPKFNPKAAKQIVDPETVELPSEAVEQMHSFVTVIALMYREENAFHNFRHAAHCVQSVTKLLARIIAPEDMEADNLGRHSKRRAQSKLDDWTFGAMIAADPVIQFTAIVAAMIHDVDHPGVPNSVLVNSGSPMAQHFRNKSVAEQNSLEVTWDLLMDDAYADLCACIFTNEEELHRFRSLLVNSILATDIADGELNNVRKLRWDKAFQAPSVAATPTPGKAEFVSVVDDQNRKATIVLEHLMMASDVAHTMQHWEIYIDFNENLFEEMYEAYKNGHVPQDPSERWYEGELGFFDHYIIPLANKLDDCGCFGVSSTEFLCYALDNRNEWERKGKFIVEKYVRKYGVNREVMVAGRDTGTMEGQIVRDDDGSPSSIDRGAGTSSYSGTSDTGKDRHHDVIPTKNSSGESRDGSSNSVWSMQDEKMGARRDLDRRRDRDTYCNAYLSSTTSPPCDYDGSIRGCSDRTCAEDHAFDFTDRAHRHVRYFGDDDYDGDNLNGEGSVRSIFGESDHPPAARPGAFMSNNNRHELDVDLRSSRADLDYVDSSSRRASSAARASRELDARHHVDLRSSRADLEYYHHRYGGH